MTNKEHMAKRLVVLFEDLVYESSKQTEELVLPSFHKFVSYSLYFYSIFASFTLFYCFQLQFSALFSYNKYPENKWNVIFLQGNSWIYIV